MRRLLLILLATIAALLLAACSDGAGPEVEELQRDVEELQEHVDVLTREVEIARDARGELEEDLKDLEDARVDVARESAATAHAASAAADAAASAADAAAAALAEAAAAGAVATDAEATAAAADAAASAADAAAAALAEAAAAGAVATDAEATAAAAAAVARDAEGAAADAVRIAKEAAEDVGDAEDRLEVVREELAAALTWIAQLSERVGTAAGDPDARDAALKELWSAIDDIHDRLNVALGGLAAPLRPYFQELDVLARTSDAAAQEILDAWIRALEAGDLSAAKEHFQDLVAVKSEFSMSVATLDPPPQMAGLHADFVEGVQAFAAALADHERALAPAATIEEYQRILDTYGESASFETAYERYEDACFRLQDFADRSGIDADLRCDAL